jgi:uroporphyrinogen decarboxylase
MNSRERILETLHFGQTDRVAIDLGGTNATGVNAIVYGKLKKLLNISGGSVKVFDVLGQLAEIELDVLEKMGGDVVALRKLAPAIGLPVRAYREGTLRDGTPCLVPDTFNPALDEKGDAVIYKKFGADDRVHPFRIGQDPSLFDKGKVVARCPRGSNAFCRVYHPLMDVDSAGELEKYEFPEMNDEEIAFAGKEAKRLYEETDKAICGQFYGSVFETGQMYWGYENFFVYLATEPELMEAYFRRRTDCFLRDLERYLEAVGSYIQVINFWEDLGTQSSLLVSPELYRKMVKPYHAKLFGYVRKHYPSVKVLLHSCGAIFDLIPDFLEIGVQVLNPVQITAAGMDPARLKKTFGKELVFWGGGVDTQHTLNSGTPEQVRRMAQEMLGIFAPGGGYVFSQVHNVESNVPAENLLAAFETAKNFRL